MKTIYHKRYDKRYEKCVYVWRDSYICPKCSRGLMSRYEAKAFAPDDDKLDDWCVPIQHSLSDYVRTCPKCDYTFGIHDWCNKVDNDNSQLDIYDVQYSEIAELTSESLHYDHDKKRFIVFLSFVKKTPTKNGLIVKTFFVKWVVDMKKHTAMFLNPKSKKFVNATNHFGGTLIPYDHWMRYTSMTLWAKLLKYMCAMKGVLPLYRELSQAIYGHTLGSYTKELLEYNGWSRQSAEKLFKKHAYAMVNLLNRMPNAVFCYDEYLNTHKYIYDIRQCEEDYYLSKFVKDSPHELMDYQEYLRYMIEKYKLPKSKSFWKLYLENPYHLNAVMYFKSCGFKNQDNLLHLVTGSDINDSVVKNNLHIFTISFAGNKNNENRLRLLSEILKRMNKMSPETAVVKKFNSLNVDRDACAMQDLIFMYEKVKKENKEFLSIINWAGSFVEIHDELSQIITKIRYANKEIPYQKADYGLVENINGYTFELAKDTNQLVEIGQKMGICVGSYREAALSQYSKIVHVTYDSKYVGCIELTSKHALIQAKAKYNNMMSGNLAKAMRKWVKIKKIKNPENCYDYRRLDEETHSTYDYHGLELNENGDVVNRRRGNEAIVRDIDDGWLDELAF